MIKAYHRPESIDSALRLAARPGITTRFLNSRSLLDARIDESVDEVIDLQAIGLMQVTSAAGGFTAEALVTLQALVELPALPDALREIIRAEDNYTMRNMRTISSVVLAPDWESHLLAALLVCDAALTLQSSQGRRQIALADVLSGGETVLAGELLTAVTLHTDGSIAAARVARTPADKPIVAAAARRLPDGTVRLALCGVAAQPMLVEPEQVTGLNPPGDFRGSGEYRLEMAKLLSARVLESLEAAS